MKIVRILVTILSFCVCFAVAAAWAETSIDPTAPVVRTEEQLVRETVCAAMQKDETYKPKSMSVYKKIVSGSDGWVFRTGTDFRTDFSLHPQTAKYMKRLQNVFAAQGITFMYLVPPTRGLANGEHATGDDLESVNFRKNRDKAQASYHAMLQSLTKDGVNVVGFADLDSGKDYFYKRDHHWNPDGAKLAAERTAAFLKTKPVYETLKKTAYVTKDKGAFDYAGPFGEIIQPICKLFLMAEQTHKFETELAATSGDGAALFDDKGFPEVVLIGTSNSASDPSVANFEGFLKEALGTDIYNASIVGAGIDAPILGYLNSDAYEQHKPKVVIWEIPGYYDMNVFHSRIFRQAIPAVVNDCPGKAVAENKIAELKGTEEIVLSGLGGKNVSGSNYYLTLNFSTKVKQPVTIALNYRNWTDDYKASRPPRYPYDGEYFMLLKDTKSGPLEKVTLKLPDEVKGTSLEVRVCKMPASVSAVPAKK